MSTRTTVPCHNKASGNMGEVQFKTKDSFNKDWNPCMLKSQCGEPTSRNPNVMAWKHSRSIRSDTASDAFENTAKTTRYWKRIKHQEPRTKPKETLCNGNQESMPPDLRPSPALATLGTVAISFALLILSLPHGNSTRHTKKCHLLRSKRAKQIQCAVLLQKWVLSNHRSQAGKVRENKELRCLKDRNAHVKYMGWGSLQKVHVAH